MATQTVNCVSASSCCFNETGDRLLRTSAVAKRLHRTMRAVRYIAERKQIPAIKRGKLWFFKESDVDEYRQYLELRYVQ